MAPCTRSEPHFQHFIFDHFSLRFMILPPPGRAGQTPPSYGGGGSTIVLTVFAAICMAVCGGLAVRSLFRTLGWVLNIGWFGPFTMIGPLHQV